LVTSVPEIIAGQGRLSSCGGRDVRDARGDRGRTGSGALSVPRRSCRRHESFGRLFKNALKIYAYPQLEAKIGALVTAGNLRAAPHLRHLYEFMLENRFAESIRDFDERCLSIYPRDALARLRTGDAGRESMLPPEAAELSKVRRPLRSPGPSDSAAAPAA
jgi:hypothetical protein